MALSEASPIGGPTLSRACRIVYLAPADIQVGRVDRQSIVYFCSALARAGADVELVALGIRLSRSERHQPDDPLDLYAVQTPFALHVIESSLHQESKSPFVGLARLRAYVPHVLRRLRNRRRGEPLVFYVKNYVLAAALLGLRGSARDVVVLFEAHTLPQSKLHRYVLGRVDGVVANSHALGRELISRVLSRNVLPTHQGVDLAPYQKAPARDEVRRRLSLPSDRALVVYTGKLYPGYDEIEYIVQAAATPACRDFLFVLVGGRDDHAAAWREAAQRRDLTNVLFPGFVPPAEVHQYHVAADALLMYYPSWVTTSAFASPGKLFGYMAAGRPIIAVDLPVLREVLGDPPAATLVPADTPTALAEAIASVVSQPDRARQFADAAKERVAEFTWDARSEHVMAFALECFERRQRGVR
jgi:glycosyltransferase involved in cell wall biosynthesis